MDTNITSITPDDNNYPPLLKEIHQPPSILYIRGNTKLLKHKQLLAVVGIRKPSAYGQQAIEKILPDVVSAGIPIVSGLAYGIDSLAHRVCVDHHLPTIAILGSGIDDTSIYPRSHMSLAHRILACGGAVVSEYPSGSRIYQSNFPERNRIIAGLCQATLLVQAAKRSGSLITARLALEQDREVLAIPGAITDKLSAGTNNLIQQGATPILSSQDILDLFHIDKSSGNHPAAQLTKQQRAVLQHLSSTPQHIDEIVSLSQLPSSTISITLTELELGGAIQNVGGMKYVKK